MKQRERMFGVPLKLSLSLCLLSPLQRFHQQMLKPSVLPIGRDLSSNFGITV